MLNVFKWPSGPACHSKYTYSHFSLVEMEREVGCMPCLHFSRVEMLKVGDSIDHFIGHLWHTLSWKRQRQIAHFVLCTSQFTLLKAHISGVYRSALLYFVVTAHELSVPGMIMYFSGFCNCLQIAPFCPQALLFHPTPSQLGKDLTGRRPLLHRKASSRACRPPGCILSSCELALVSNCS